MVRKKSTGFKKYDAASKDFDRLFAKLGRALFPKRATYQISITKAAEMVDDSANRPRIETVRTEGYLTFEEKGLDMHVATEIQS